MAFSLDDKNVKTLLVVVVVGLVLYLLVSYMHDSKRPHAHIFGDKPSNHNNTVVQNNTYNDVVDNVAAANNVAANNLVEDNFLDYVNEGFDNENGNVEPSEGVENNEVEDLVPQGSASGNQLPAECYPKDVLSSTDLLPGDANSKWAQSTPNGEGSLTDKNFLNAGFHVGVNTVGQSLRNANRQLRSDPPNPQVKVSPLMQTTIEPDVNRKAMEIGA